MHVSRLFLASKDIGEHSGGPTAHNEKSLISGFPCLGILACERT